MVLNALGAVVVLYLVGKVGQTIKHNYDLGRQINTLSGEVAILQAQNDNLNYQIKYYATSSYQERQAHSQLNLQLPGETEVVLPSPSPVPVTTSPSKTSQSAAKSNWSQWIAFLRGSN
jgi:cell division protein FtsB